jgi:hypothetical protein
MSNLTDTVCFSIDRSQLHTLPRDVLAILVPFISDSHSKSHDLNLWTNRVCVWLDEQGAQPYGRVDQLLDYVQIPNESMPGHRIYAGIEASLYIRYSRDPDIMPFSVFRLLVNRFDSSNLLAHYRESLNDRARVREFRENIQS